MRSWYRCCDLNATYLNAKSLVALQLACLVNSRRRICRPQRKCLHVAVKYLHELTAEKFHRYCEVCDPSIAHTNHSRNASRNHSFDKHIICSTLYSSVVLHLMFNFITLLCYAVIWYGMVCYAMLCYAMLCYAMLCYAMLCYAMLCYAMLCYAMLCYAMLCYAVIWYAML
jgi:hypothetical protein